MRLFTPRQSADAANPGHTRALIVEDSSSDAVLAGQALDQFGIRERHVVRSGEEALEYLAKKQVDLVLCDFNLPRMNGLEVLQIVREDYPDTQVILVTGARDEQVAVAAMKLGAADYISKDEFLTSGIIQSVGTALRTVETERLTSLKAAPSIETALNEASWLFESESYSHAGLRETEASPPEELRAMLDYLQASIAAFPRRALAQEDQVISLIVGRGHSPRSIVLLFAEALTSLKNASEGDELPFNPTLLLAALLKRLAEEHERQLAVAALATVHQEMRGVA